MTTDAVNVILDKAWEIKAHAFLFVDKMTFDINSEEYNWEVYDALDVLCIFNKKTKIETYLSVDYISEIAVKIPTKGS